MSVVDMRVVSNAHAEKEKVVLDKEDGKVVWDMSYWG